LTRAAWGAAAIAGFVLIDAAGAQVQTTTFTREDGVTVQNSAPRRNGFSLFAEEDLAGTSLRLTGRYRYALFNGGGLCTFAGTAGDIFNSSCGQFNGGNAYFHIASAWAAGLDAYRSIRSVHPDIATMRAPIGYTSPFRLTSVSPIVTRIGPADGQFGKLFSGVTSANGEGCRDMQGASGAGLPANFTLLASSDCPETWATSEWAGIREIPDSVWVARFQSKPNLCRVNGADVPCFRWDDWKIPASEIGDTPPLGNNASFGMFSDFQRENIQKYGGVTPRGGGPPQERGFPLGIEVRVDAFKFDRPSLRDGVFVRWLVINSSEKVWGAPIDYDSLAFGIDPGYIFGGQRPNVHNIIKAGVHTAGGGQLSGRCSTTYPRRVPPGANEGCDGNTGNFPFIMFLKSPLGDLRNKMFTMTNADGSPRFPNFYDPNHPERDDTITFNRFFQGGFGNAQLRYQGRSDRAYYGAMAGREADALDGRLSTDYTAAQLWSDFLYEGTDGSNGPQNAVYNKSVPSSIPGYGAWDWNDDGIPDTLKVPDCGQFGCAQPWNDTIAGGFTSDNGENIGSFLGISEFALAAGDTTEFMFYLGGVVGRDTIQFWRTIQNITDAYMKNYAGAQAYPTPTISASDVQLSSAFLRDSTDNEQTVDVRITLKMPPRQNDAFLASVLARIEGPEGATLRRLNPTLVNDVRRRMEQNLAEVLVFKSCDRGVSWTSDGGCTSAVAQHQTRDEQGVQVGIGWRPRFRLTLADSGANNGILNDYVVSEEVQGGREYLYSVVTKTRSLRDIQVVLSETVDGAGNVTARTIGTLQDALSVDIDTITSPLRASGPSTVLVYAPLSVPAGTIFARLDTATVQGSATNRVDAEATTGSISGNYRFRFGNRFVVTRVVNTTTGVTTTTVERQSVYERGTTDPAGPATLNFVAAADTFSGTGPLSYSTGGNTANIQNLSTTPRSTVGDIQTFVDTISKAGYVIAAPSGEAIYLAVGNSFLPGGNTGIAQNTTIFEGAPNNPGFTAVMQSETAPNSARLATVVRTAGDTLNTGVVNGNGVIYQATGSNLFNVSTNRFRTLGYTPGGYWNLIWSGDSFGPGAPFSYGTAEVLQPVIDASLAARPTAQTASTDEAFRTLANFPTGAIGARTGVIAAKLPFRVVDEDGQPVEVLFQARHVIGNAADSILKNSILIGTNGDTARVSIPADLWMPGDTLFLVERVLADSTVTIGGNAVVVVRDTTINGRTQRLPVQVERQLITMRLRMACNSNSNPARNTCNPLRLNDRGSTGYLPFENGYVSVIHLNRQFEQNSEVGLTAVPVRANTRPLNKTDMERIHAVPNPYVVQSQYDQVGTNRGRIEARIRFVNVPAEGVMRIYSISGQLLQQLSWTPADLIAAGDNSPHGDLPYNLRTREGLDLGPGLYMYVLTPRGENANGMVARGKFVIIR
jgi:hypothetical protein